MKKKIGIVCMGLGIFLLCAMAGLMFYNHLQDSRAKASSAQALEEFAQKLENGDIIPPQGSFENAGINLNNYPVIELDGTAYIGYLTIPDLDLVLPVIDEWTEDRLWIAPCRYYGSQEENNLVIAAHNSTQHFGHLYQLEPGADIYFTNVENITTRYQVQDIELLYPNDVLDMIESQYDLTLYTCTYDATRRVTIRADRVYKQ